MKKEESVCNPDFSIELLADLTGHNSRYLSQVINDNYSCNYTNAVSCGR